MVSLSFLHPYPTPSPIPSLRTDPVRVDVEPAAPKAQQFAVFTQETSGVRTLRAAWPSLPVRKGQVQHRRCEPLKKISTINAQILALSTVRTIMDAFFPSFEGEVV
jgi:hypothetical protein